jgi:hypothetical protein
MRVHLRHVVETLRAAIARRSAQPARQRSGSLITY